MAKTEAEAPLRVGAKAKKLIASIDKPEAQVEKAVKKAESLARENGDRMLRDYYLYQALGLEMPASVQADWDYFRANGKERPGASTGTDGAAKTKKAAAPAKAKGGASSPPSKSGGASFKPDPKSGGKPSGGRSKRRDTKSATEAPSTDSKPENGTASSEKSLPNSSDVLEI